MPFTCLLQETVILPALFEKFLSITESRHLTIITDGLDSYNVPIAVAYPKAKHCVYTSFSDILNNNLISLSTKLLRLGTKRKKDFTLLIRLFI